MICTIMKNETFYEEEDFLNDLDITISSFSLTGATFQLLPKDFKFIFSGKEYYCSCFLAEFVSPLISRKRSEDKNFKEFNFNITSDSFNFNQFIQLAHGSEIEIDIKDTPVVMKIAILLENEEIQQQMLFLNDLTLTKSNVIPILIEKYNFSFDMSKEIEFIAKNFYKFNDDALEQLPFDALQKILSHPKLMKMNEASLYRFIRNMFQKYGEKYGSLYELIEFRLLSKEDLEQVCKVFTPQFFRKYPMVWNSLAARLSEGITPMITMSSRYSYLYKELKYEKGNYWSGVFSYLTKKNECNPYPKFVNMFQFRTGCNEPIQNLLDYKNPGCKWYLVELENNFIQFDFINSFFAMTGYAIESGSKNSYWEYPVYFTWEGSNDNKTWKEIDSKDANSDLGANEKKYYWNVRVSPNEHNFYRHIRFRIRKVERSGGLYTRHFELFGIYKYNEISQEKPRPRIVDPIELLLK